MKIRYSQPDIETIVKRINALELNLQPNFQRGEVWSPTKKQRLIDSILRDWHVPPIHVIELADGNQEVLDGQQRLAAIRDFANGDLAIDGSILPYDQEIMKLDGFRFKDLPRKKQNEFNRFTITVNTITEYESQEPGELFYRLNQPIKLSSAEERNAFFGEPRQQVKHLVSMLTENELDIDFLGFSNSRMAYDDVLARLCYSLELGTLHEKVEASMLANKYRANEPFSERIIGKVSKSIQLLGKARSHVGSIEKRKFNRASLFSWLLFLINVETIRNQRQSPEFIGNYIFFFENMRAKRRLEPISYNFKISKYTCASSFVDQLMEIYIDRSTSRVTDINSVLGRDIILWTFYGFYLTETKELDASNSLLKMIIKHIELSNTGKSKNNAFAFLENLTQEWDLPK
jgi:hypothetical protein